MKLKKNCRPPPGVLWIFWMKTLRSPSSLIRLMSLEAMAMEYQTPDICRQGTHAGPAGRLWLLGPPSSQTPQTVPGQGQCLPPETPYP